MCVRNLFLFCTLLCISECYNILAIFPTPSHSHHTLASKLAKELAERKHNVTFVNPFPQTESLDSFKEISVEEIIPVFNRHKKNLFKLNEQTLFENVIFVNNVGLFVTEELLRNEKIQKLLHSDEHFDLVILPQFINEGLFGIGHHFKAPVVLLAPMPLFSWSSFLLGHPTLSSYVPNIQTPYTGRMNFWQRLCNSIYDAYSILYHQWVVLPKHRQLVKKYIPGQPDLYDFLNNASLLLVNSHLSSYDATIQIPNVVEIGGFHLEEGKKLPEDLQKYLDNSKQGVVLFSMGTLLKSSNMPKEKLQALIQAFSKLKQNVLWKWDSEKMEGKPQNVKLLKWLPQSDVLAHPNVMVFITHGGLLSTMESIYHGVPTLGIPVFTDQKANMEFAVAAGSGIAVPYAELSEEKLSFSLNEILNDRNYKKNVIKRSKVMKDRAIHPLDYAIYWIEYVARHEGAPHLRYPGIDLAWYQRYLLDVAVFIGLTSVIILGLVFIVVKQLSKLCGKAENENEIKKKLN